MRGRAVHADRADRRTAVEDLVRSGKRLARPGRAVRHGVAEPRRQPDLVEQRHQHLRLVGVGDRLHREQIGPGSSELSHTADEHVDVSEVIAAAGLYASITRHYFES